MILVDTGPIVALFNPNDGSHARCVEVMKSIEEPLVTTVPVVTEAFHLLVPSSRGSQGLMDFIAEGGLSLWYMNDGAVVRAFELMLKYADGPIDLADASLIVAAEAEKIRAVFTLDRDDFSVYRVRHGHRHFRLVVSAGPPR